MESQNHTLESADRLLLRHMLATLAYRGGKALRGAPDTFAQFQASATTRTPSQILTHICDLLDWGLSIASGKQEWHNSSQQSWDEDTNRFFTALSAWDGWLAGSEPIAVAPEKLFQGPIADAFTHVGQIALLRRMAGAPVKAENYFKAEIITGRVSADQHAPKREFD